MDTDSFPALAAAVRREKILTCLIIQDDKPLFTYARSPKLHGRLQKLNSCTKSVLSLLVGIAHADGLIPDLEAPLRGYFPEVLRYQGDPRKARLTLRHLLTMTDGLDWPEFGAWDMAYEDSMTSANARSLIEQVEALVAKVDNKNIRELFRSFARVDRYLAA